MGSSSSVDIGGSVDSACSVDSATGEGSTGSASDFDNVGGVGS